MDGAAAALVAPLVCERRCLISAAQQRARLLARARPAASGGAALLRGGERESRVVSLIRGLRLPRAEPKGVPAEREHDEMGRVREGEAWLHPHAKEAVSVT